MTRRVPLSGIPGAQTLDDTPGVAGALWLAQGQRVIAFGPACVLKTAATALQAHPDATRIWERQQGRAVTAAGSRTDNALRLLRANPSLTPAAAARQAGLHVSAVYRALQRTEAPACKHCGQRLPA